MNLNRIIIGPILAIVFIVVFVYAFIGGKMLLGDVDGNNAVANISEAVSGENSDNVQVEPINAEAALSVETNLQKQDYIVFANNPKKQLPVASITKLMTAVVALDNYDLSARAKISNRINFFTPAAIDINPGDIVNVRGLLEMALIESSNRAAYSLSEIMGEKKFVELMNQKAKSLNMDKTYFVEATGLVSGNVSSADDLVKLTKYILINYPQITWITSTKELNIEGVGKITNTDLLLEEFPGAVVSKTGFTDSAKGCLLLAIKNSAMGNYCINVILGADDRFAEMKKLIKNCEK